MGCLDYVGRTVRKWVDRYRAHGAAGLLDRSSQPQSSPSQTPLAVRATIEALRRQRLTGRHIAKQTGVSPSTVSRLLRRLKLSRIRDLEPREPVQRYERNRAGELLHIDIKKLGRFDKVGRRITGDRTSQSNSRGVGRECVHVAINDHSRIAFSQILPDQKAASAAAFFRAAVTYYASLGVSITRLMTDNAGCYRSFAFRNTCKDLGIKHIRTKPYSPKTNGKAERFVQTILREWAYARPYANSCDRACALPGWLHQYNWHRPHGGIGFKTPMTRLDLTGDLMTIHS